MKIAIVLLGFLVLGLAVIKISQLYPAGSDDT